MKFSYPLIKKLAKIAKSKKDIIDKLNIYSFEAEDLGGNSMEISIPANRYSDAASHLGVAREISAIYGKNFSINNGPSGDSPTTKTKFRIQNSGVKAPFKVFIKDKNLCSRYIGQYFENIKVGDSPKFIKDTLIDCGLRPINNVVDIMNYAMLETGQPLHAFDYDKLENIIVRRAKKGEKITTLDGQIYNLDNNVLVIADNKNVLAIAGIKGGKIAEIDKNTKRIIIESANFNSLNIYKTSKTFKILSDASIRFSHQLSPELAYMGISRVGWLLKNVINARPGGIIDIYPKKQERKLIKFDIKRFKDFIGIEISKEKAFFYLSLLGFKATGEDFIEVPGVRADIEGFEDICEEAARIYGYNNIKGKPPIVHIIPTGFEDSVVLKDKTKKVLTGMGLTEVYNYSFISEAEAQKLKSKESLLEIENPIAEDKKYLRPNLRFGVSENIKNNLRFFNEFGIFEIGKVFSASKNKNISERTMLAAALASKNKETFFELKGIISSLFKKIGLVDYSFAVGGKNLLNIKSENKEIGYLISEKERSLCEIDFDKLLSLIIEENEYRPLLKYPSIMRDISAVVPPGVLIEDIIRVIQYSNREIIKDVDLIDEYKNSFTFRIIFQSEEKTLKDEEVNGEMEKIKDSLIGQFKAIIR